MLALFLFNSRVQTCWLLLRGLFDISSYIISFLVLLVPFYISGFVEWLSRGISNNRQGLVIRLLLSMLYVFTIIFQNSSRNLHHHKKDFSRPNLYFMIRIFTSVDCDVGSLFGCGEVRLILSWVPPSLGFTRSRLVLSFSCSSKLFSCNRH